MAKHWRLPSKSEPLATARIAGIIERQPDVVRVPGPNRQVARIKLQVGPETFEAVGYGDAAKELGELASGTFVAVCGQLVHRLWKTADKTTHHRVELVVKNIKIGPRSPGYDK